MKSIYNPSDFEEVKERVKLLSSTHARVWGKMTVQQMVAHCTAQLKLALGETKSEKQGPSFMRSAFGKWIVFSNIPWPKGVNTPKEMDVQLNPFSQTNMEDLKIDLLSYIDKVKGASHFSPHPFFGQLSQKEWGRLVYKHLDHHLKQFNQ